MCLYQSYKAVCIFTVPPPVCMYFYNYNNHLSPSLIPQYKHLSNLFNILPQNGVRKLHSFAFQDRPKVSYIHEVKLSTVRGGGGDNCKLFVEAHFSEIHNSEVCLTPLELL